MGLSVQKKGLILSLKWNEVYLWGVTACMFLFGLWGLYDGLEIGSSRAGWKFVFLFVVLITPSLAALLFFKPKNGDA